VSLAGTWNTSGTPTALLLNITNTASNVASKLFDLQTGGVSRLAVTAGGVVTVHEGVTNVRTKIDDNGIFFSRASDGGYTQSIEGNTTSGINYDSRSTHSFRTNLNIGMTIFLTDGINVRTVIGSAAPTSTSSLFSVQGGASIGASYTATAAPTNGLLVQGSVLLRSVITDVTTKTGQVQVGHYNNAEEDFALLGGSSAFGVNTLNLGGGSSALNTATSIILYTAANEITLTGTARLTLDSAGLFTLWDGGNFALGTTTGTKIGTATTQKLGFWNATPVVRPVLATGAGATADSIITVLQNLGLVGQT